MKRDSQESQLNGRAGKDSRPNSRHDYPVRTADRLQVRDGGVAATTSTCCTSLREHGIEVEIADNVPAARSFVNAILPRDETILTTSSETIRLSGLDEDINKSGKYKSLRQQLGKMDVKTQFPEMRRLGAAPDVVIGSVHAITGAR